jgi:hypothetical protein
MPRGSGHDGGEFPLKEEGHQFTSMLQQNQGQNHMTENERNQLTKRLYERLRNRYKFVLQNSVKNAPKPIENPDSEDHPEDRQKAFLRDLNSLQEFQDDVWSKGTV